MVFIACLATCLSSNIAFRFSDTQTHFARKYLHGRVAGVPAGGDVLRQQDGEGVAAGQGERVLRPPVVRGQGWPLAVIAAAAVQLEERSRLVKGTICSECHCSHFIADCNFAKVEMMPGKNDQF